jgi:hypothetical protein
MSTNINPKPLVDNINNPPKVVGPPSMCSRCSVNPAIGGSYHVDLCPACNTLDLAVIAQKIRAQQLTPNPEFKASVFPVDFITHSIEHQVIPPPRGSQWIPKRGRAI